MFSKACEYGIKAAVYIVEQSQNKQKVSLKDIAKAIDSPESYTSKILQQLSRSNLIISEKGPMGGFSILDEEIHKVTLSQVVSAIDGDEIYSGCGLGFKKCNEEKPCVLHNRYKSIRNELKEMLETTLLVDLSEDIDKGIAFLKYDQELIE